MRFNLKHLMPQEQKLFQMFLKLQNHETGEDGITIFLIHTKDAVLKVEYAQGEVRLYGQERVHFFRGLHLFLQKIQEETEKITIQEKISFSQIGLMLDLSRNGVMKPELLQEFILMCAATGMNQIYLYMEDVYEIPEDPYFGAYRGKYRKEELRYLDEFAQMAGVELIPCIQTLAHLHTYLRWPETKKLQDTGDILLVGSQDTREFVRQMIHHASEPFHTDKIHVGMDEAAMLGLGMYMHKNGYQERYKIMTEHLNMVLDICKEEKLHPMIWSDMFFRLKSPTGDYYDLSPDTEFGLEGQVPKNLELVYWDYYHHEQKEYDKNIMLHHKISENIRYAGGGWTWNGIAPNYQKAEKTLAEGMRSCKENGIDKVMNTFWFDNGTETPMHAIFYTALYFAQLCYHDQVEEEAFDTWLTQLTGYGKADFALLDRFDSPRGILPENENADNPSKYSLYQDPLAGIFDGQIQGHGLDRYYRELAQEFHNLNQKKSIKGVTEKMFHYYETLAQLLEKKSMLGVELRGAYKEKNKEELQKLAEQMKVCEHLALQLKEQREEIWFQECRPFGFEVLDIRMGGVATRLASGRKRIQEYLQGNTEKLEELEEPMVVYGKGEKGHSLCMCNMWQDIVSAGNIAGV